jgi:hypothetical protein
MREQIVSRELLTQQLLSRIIGDKVRIQEDEHSLTVYYDDCQEPVPEFFGMFANSGLSVADFCKEKQMEKNLE